jgi:metal-responsive CopG/Arc/MetJ family transcriptional regulator
MPNQPATTIRGVRIPDDIWEDAKLVAKAEGFNGVSEMIRDCLELRIADYRSKHPAPDDV